MIYHEEDTGPPFVRHCQKWRQMIVSLSAGTLNVSKVQILYVRYLNASFNLRASRQSYLEAEYKYCAHHQPKV